MTDENIPSTEGLITVPADVHGVRLDAFLAKNQSEHSRARWQALIAAAQVTVDGGPARPSQKISAGMRIAFTIPATTKTSLAPEPIPLDVLFEDDDVIVVNKRAGMVVHPAAGVAGGTLVNALLHHVPALSVGGEERPGIVHRLDRETSGVLVCAKHDAALRSLQRAFHDRRVEKRYMAVAFGVSREAKFTLVTGHARHPQDRKRFTTKLPAPEDGDAGSIRRAVATYQVRASRDFVTLLDVELGTGRTHQIRAQLSDKALPLVRDDLYGGGRIPKRIPDGAIRAAVESLRRHALHARSLEFPHPSTEETMRFEAPIPDDLQPLIAAILAEDHA